MSTSNCKFEPRIPEKRNRNDLFLIKQNIAFRGHDKTGNSLNKGNFHELFSLRGKDVPILKQKAKFSYTSNTTQNQILEILACKIKQKLLSKFKDRRFDLIVDKTIFQTMSKFRFAFAMLMISLVLKKD